MKKKLYILKGSNNLKTTVALDANMNERDIEAYFLNWVEAHEFDIKDCCWEKVL